MTNESSSGFTNESSSGLTNSSSSSNIAEHLEDSKKYLDDSKKSVEASDVKFTPEADTVSLSNGVRKAAECSKEDTMSVDSGGKPYKFQPILTSSPDVSFGEQQVGFDCWLTYLR